MSCINKNHPEIVKMAEELNTLPAVIAVKAGMWQEKNNNFDRFPTVNELNKSNEVNYQKNQTISNEGIIASEKTIRDLAAKIADRIGMTVKFESDRSKEYKGKIENNVAYVNLSYATLDTPIHEILGHPIIRAIKNNSKSKLYENVLKELEIGKGEEVLDRIKRDYVNKYSGGIIKESFGTYLVTDKSGVAISDNFKTKQEAIDYALKLKDNNKYSLEEQQEEAVVELLGLMTAEKLDNVKDGKLISLLKRLLKEMKQYIRSLINQKEIEIDKLPDNITINDLADLLAYSNSKIILPGYEVEYTTPDNTKFKTYQEANNHISELAKNIKEVDLDNIDLSDADLSEIDYFENSHEDIDDGSVNKGKFKKENNKWFVEWNNDGVQNEIEEKYVLINYRENSGKGLIKNFIEKNKEYEQSKEIIEEWKKVNNIVYNPEEIYSRGQEFSSVVGAYSDFDVNLMMQNLLSHIEDNEKAGGKFAISAYTKPVDKQIGHLEGGGGKIKFKLYPQSNDILWAANTDVYSGSVWDASEKVNKDKKSELLGVSYTKYPSLRSINTVQPNLADIVDNLNHHHNELGIALTGNNFRLEYDEDIPYTTKKVIDGINKILDQKYGKLVKPEIKSKKLTLEESKELKSLQELGEQSMHLPEHLDKEDLFTKKDQERLNELISLNGIQPTQTNNNLKENIQDISGKIQYKSVNIMVSTTEFPNNKVGDIVEYQGKQFKILTEQRDADYEGYDYGLSPLDKPVYTEQALINTKIAALKEVVKAQPRSLIRSEVKPISNYDGYVKVSGSEDLFDLDELPFQKIPSIIDNVNFSNVDQYLTAEKRTSNSNNKLLFKNKIKTPTVNEVLNNIVDNYKDLTDEAKELIKRSNKLLNKSKAKIKFVSEDYLDKGLKESEKGQTVMGYDANTNTIVISKDRLEKFNSREVVVAFLHEIVHGQTVEAMQKEPKDRTFAEQELVDVVENFMKTEHAQELKGQYGFKDKFEFVSEFYANPEFRENVKKVSDKWWRDLINSIRRLFTIPANPEYTKLFNTIINFVENKQQDFDGIKRYDGLFRKRFVSEGEYNSLDDKFNILNKKALENVENVLKLTIKANEKRPTELRIKHITETKELLDSIKEYQNTEKWKAVLSYAKAFQSSLNFVNTKLDEIIESKNLYEDDLVPSLERYKEYSASYDLLEDVRSLLNKAELEQTTFNEEERKEYKELHEFFNKALASKTDVDGKFQAIYHKQGLKLYSNPIYNTEVETIHRDELRKEYNNLSEEAKQGRSVDEYINEMINTRDLNDFSEDLKAKATNVMSEPSLDIDQSSLWLDDSLNIKSPTIQIINNVFGHNFSIVKDFVLTKVHQMNKNYKEFTKGKSHKPSEINKNLIEKTEDCQHYLRGKYSIKYKESFDKLTPVFEAKKELIKSELEKGSKEEQIKKSPEYKLLNKQIALWFKNNTIKKDGKTVPHPKFLNKEISKEEQKQLNVYTQIWDENDKIEGFSSLVNKTVGARFYQLASNTKSDLERRIEADTKGLLKDKWDDLTKVKPDDIGIQNDKTPGSLIQKVKTHYRGKIDSNLQSLDLETMARNEYWNGQNYKSKKDLQHKMNVFLEVVASKPYYDKKGGKTYSGIHSKEYKKILGMVERNVYDIFSHQSDMNKVTSQISGYAASLAMSFNLASGTANLANGLTVLFVEKFGNDKIKSGTLGKAETKYTKELLNGNLLKDTTNSVKKHYFNQLLEKFDVMGGLGQNEQEAIRNSLLSKFGSTKMMNFINEGGEHMMHCVITEAILDSIKVMNSDYKYIDKDGKVTTEDKAASLVDMLYMDSQGQLQMSDKVFYTSQNRVTKYHEGGSSNVNMLIKKKVFDLFGVYDVKFKNELSKTWYGKTVMMFKNFFMSGLANRWTGIKTSTKDKSLLENDDKFYNSAEKEYIEGTYVTMIRFVKNNVIPNLKELNLIYQSYDNLSDYEKANLRKATMELLISSVVLPSVGFMLAALAGSNGDDDDDMLWFSIYLNARLGQELRQFWNPIDANKMISNPVAATRFINNGLNFCYDIISPINFSPSENESTFDYLSEDKKGRNILGKHFNQLIPITSQFKELGGFLGKDYHQMYGLQYGK